MCVRFRWSMCVIVQNFVFVGQTVAEMWRFFVFFKIAAVRHLRFVMCIFGPPYDKYLVAFITVQSLVGIDAVLSIICKCRFLTHLAWKHFLLTPRYFKMGLPFPKLPLPIGGSKPQSHSHQKRGTAPNLRPMSIVAKRLDASGYHEARRSASSQATLC